MRVLHAIHDFLPRHRAGSEIYVDELCQALLARGDDVWLLATDYDLSRDHGTLVWRTWRDLPVVELINNWVFRSFEETWRSPEIGAQLARVLDVLEPDVVHLHSFLNLTFELPTLCRERGIPTVATLHDFTLVCPSGGQRVHREERHVCHAIDVERCARCFRQHNFHGRLVYGSLGLPGARRGGGSGPVRQAMRKAAAVAPRLLSRVPAGPSVTPESMRIRLDAAVELFTRVDRWIAPSRALGEELVRLGLPPERLEVSDYGFVKAPFDESSGERRGGPAREGVARPLRVGFVGTLVWHKGAHVLLEALRRLHEELGEGRFEAHVWGSHDTFPDYVEELRRATDGLPVELHGGFAADRTNEVYRSFDVLVVASLWPENSPLVIHEAFMAGVPVIGADMGGIPGLVEHERSGLLYDAFSAEDLAAQLRRLFDEPGLLERLSRSLPRVKSIGEDAEEWRRRYRQVRAGIADQPPVGTGGPGEERDDERDDEPDEAGGTVAVVLNYGTPHDTVLAVRSLLRSDTPPRAICVVDNASPDDSKEVLERRLGACEAMVELHFTDRNLGFSGGCNVGIRRALELEADSVLLVNPDVLVGPQTLGQLRAAVLDGREGPGIAAPLLLSRSDPRRVASAGLQYGSALGRMRHLQHRTLHQRLSPGAPRTVDAVAGCAMLVRREVFEEVGLLREDFFFSFEDLELCLRARRHGWTTVCVEAATALHQGSVSLPADEPLRYRYAARNHLLLARTLDGGAGPGALQRAIIVGLNLLHALRSPRRRDMVAAVRAGIDDFDHERFGRLA